jgi:hypothetical protein
MNLHALTQVTVCALFLCVDGATTFARDVHVSGYTRKDGTYVAPHYRSAPDSNRYNNWSTFGNVNPYTGKVGNVIPNQGLNSSTLYPSLPTSVPTSNFIPLTKDTQVTSTSTGIDYLKLQKSKDIERAKHWKAQGYNFDATYMTSYLMDQKVKDIERAKHWKAQGYNFDATYMTSYLMDQKVQEIKKIKPQALHVQSP